jgi:hypothetical protein
MKMKMKMKKKYRRCKKCWSLSSFFILGIYLTSCSNPLGPGSSIPLGFHPGIPTTSSSAPPGTLPTVTSVIPSSGPVTGGTTLTINGTGFVSGISVLIGGQACMSVNFLSSLQLTCVTPAHSAGSDPLVVTNPDLLTATVANAFFFAGPGTTSPTFAFAAGGGFSSSAGIKARGTAGAVSGNSIVQSGGNVRAYTGIQSVLVKP